MATLDTPVGRLAVRVTEAGLAGIRWVEHDPPEQGPVDGLTGRVLDQLGAYFRGKLREFDLPLDLCALTNTQRQVLVTLQQTVGYGCSVTYGELADRSGTQVPARGIGSIMGSNPIPIVIPCHRVLAANGLGGYSGGRSGDGLQTKSWLLTLEGVLQPTLDWPKE